MTVREHCGEALCANDDDEEKSTTLDTLGTHTRHGKDGGSS